MVLDILNSGIQGNAEHMGLYGGRAWRSLKRLRNLSNRLLAGQGPQYLDIALRPDPTSNFLPLRSSHYLSDFLGAACYHIKLIKQRPAGGIF